MSITTYTSRCTQWARLMQAAHDAGCDIPPTAHIHETGYDWDVSFTIDATDFALWALFLKPKLVRETRQGQHFITDAPAGTQSLRVAVFTFHDRAAA